VLLVQTHIRQPHLGQGEVWYPGLLAAERTCSQSEGCGPTPPVSCIRMAGSLAQDLPPQAGRHLRGSPKALQLMREEAPCSPSHGLEVFLLELLEGGLVCRTRTSKQKVTRNRHEDIQYVCRQECASARTCSLVSARDLRRVFFPHIAAMIPLFDKLSSLDGLRSNELIEKMLAQYTLAHTYLW